MARLRLEITKGEEIRFVSHLDYARAMTRAVRRAKLPAAYSEGFNPHMKTTFASALAVGVTSDAEYMDIELKEQPPADEVLEALNRVVPSGIIVRQASYVSDSQAALMAVVNQADYQITVPVSEAFSIPAAQAALATFATAAEVLYTRQSPKGRRVIDLKQYVDHIAPTVLAVNGVVLTLSVKITPQGSVKPAEILDVLCSDFGMPVQPDAALIHRTALWASSNGQTVSPMRLQ